MARGRGAGAYLTTGDVAKLAGVTDERVRQWAIAGQLPVVTQAGGRRLFRRRDVERFLRMRVRRAKPKPPGSASRAKKGPRIGSPRGPGTPRISGR
jgi:excisionase family DNA binding protein